MILTSKPLAALVVAILFGGILFTSQMGWWQTTSSKVPAKLTTGEFTGQADPADIRGSYTFGDIEKNFNIPADILAQAFAVQTANPATFAVKGLEDIYAASEVEVGTSSVRLFVAFYNGLPFDLSMDIYLPESAASLLRQRPLSPEASAYLEAHTLLDMPAEPVSPAQQATSVSPSNSPAPAATPSVHATSSASGENLVKGKTTFAELLSWGLSQAAIEQILGLPLPANLNTTLKDFCTENGLDFETLKPALQAELDKL